MNNSTSSRRGFLKKAVPAAGLVTGAPAFQRRLGANDRVQTAHIGIGNQGSILLNRFMEQPDVDIVALCDIYEPYLHRDRSKVYREWITSLHTKIPPMGEKFERPVDRYADFRKVLDHKDVDAVVIATPDHWHALQMIMACDAGKDVYVEKPLSATIVEGRRMVEAARRNNRVTQVGTQRRSSKIYQSIPALIRDGAVGKVTIVRGYHISNMSPAGIGKCPPSDPPPGFDWDMWLGPRPKRPYQLNIAPYKFRWWKNYSSQVGNWGVHLFDVIRWALGEEAPASISVHGGNYVIDDDRTIPDTLEACFEFNSGALLCWGQYEATGGSAVKHGEIEFRGTLGNLYTDRSGYKILPSKGGQFQDPSERLKPKDVAAPEPNWEKIQWQHARNFVDCVKSRERCNCDIETGHRSTTFAHLANIALETKSRLEWDPKAERFTNNEEANKLLHYEYRRPWKLG